MKLLTINILIWAFLSLVIVWALADQLPKAPPILPDPTLTPGAINDELTKAEICDPHWRTKTERPDVDYTDKVKVEQLKARHYPSLNKKLYEEDHLIPLEIGGNSTDLRNLWPQAWKGKCGAHVKDRLENRMHELVCTGKVDLNRAQLEIAANWVAAYNKYVEKLSCR